MLQPDEQAEVVRGRADSGGRWALLAAVGVTSLGIAFLSFFQTPGSALDASVMSATPAPATTSAATEPTGSWAPLTGFEPAPVTDLVVEEALDVDRADIPVAAEGDTPSVLVTPTPKTKTDPNQAIGWPVSTHLVSSSFGLRSDPLTGTVRFHTGTDFPAACGLPVYASLDGTVSGAGEAGAYGNRVVINHGQHFGGQFITTYSHMQVIRTFEGQVVKRGDVIGVVGTTGRSTGCHMHFETIIGHQLYDAIPLLLGEGPSTETWPVGYFMPYGSNVTISGLVSPTPSASSGSPTPSVSSGAPGSGSPSATSTKPGASPSATVPTSPGASTPPASTDPSASTPPASSESPSPTDPPSSTAPPEPTDPPSSTAPPEPTDPPSSSEPTATPDPPASSDPPVEGSPSGEPATP